MTSNGDERWTSLEDLAAARARYTARIPGFEAAAAFGVAHVDGEGLTFGHVNGVGGIHRLPGVVLAFVCGHRAGTATYELGVDAFAEAVRLLSPAEACTQIDHPNLWSWRPLLESAPAGAMFVAIFVSDPATPPVDRYDAEFRSLLDART